MPRPLWLLGASFLACARAAQAAEPCTDPVVVNYAAGAYPTPAHPDAAAWTRLSADRKSPLCERILASWRGNAQTLADIRNDAKRVAAVYFAYREALSEQNSGRVAYGSDSPEWQRDEALRLLTRGTNISHGDRRFATLGGETVELPDHTVGYVEDFLVDAAKLEVVRFEEAPGRTIQVQPGGGSLGQRAAALEPLIAYAKVLSASPRHEPNASDPFHCLVEEWQNVRAVIEALQAADVAARGRVAARHDTELGNSRQRVSRFGDPFGLGPDLQSLPPTLAIAQPSGALLFKRQTDPSELLHPNLADAYRPQIRVRYNAPQRERDPNDKTPRYYADFLRLNGPLQEGDALLFYEPKGGPAFGGDLGHTGIAYVARNKRGVLKIYRRDASWGSTGGLMEADTMEDATFGDKTARVIVLPNHRMANGAMSGDSIRQYMDQKKTRWHAYVYCSNYAADVLHEGGDWDVGWGVTPGYLVEDLVAGQ